MIPEKKFIGWHYKNIHGYYPDLVSPQVLNEKIQWLKLYDRTPLHTQCADKYAVRSYVEKKIGGEYLVPLLYHTNNPSDLVPENMPDAPFIVKTTHANFGGTIVRDKSAVDWTSIRKKIHEQINVNLYYSSKEWQYKNIAPMIIVERLLIDQYGNIPLDYKIHCFHGHPYAIQVDIDRFTEHRRNFYDIKWQLQPFNWGPLRNGVHIWPNGREIQKPRQLQKLLDIAEQLSAHFLYARVDLYLVGDRVFFGEITFHHGGGNEIFIPIEWDKKFGHQLSLPLYHNPDPV